MEILTPIISGLAAVAFILFLLNQHQRIERLEYFLREKADRIYGRVSDLKEDLDMHTKSSKKTVRAILDYLKIDLVLERERTEVIPASFKVVKKK